MSTVQSARDDSKKNSLRDLEVSMHQHSTSENETINITKHAEKSLKVMETYFRDEYLTDVILVAGNKRIPAHRLVLSAASDYFATMFGCSMKESRQNEITLVDVDGEALFVLVECCYTGCLKLSGENVEAIFKITHLLQLTAMYEACISFLIKQLDPSNCLGIRALAETYECIELFNATHDHTSQHFVGVIENQEFLSLSVDNVAELLESEDIIVPSEETIFNALMKWIEHDSKNRSEYACQLLSHVRLPLLSPAFIDDHIRSNELFKSDKTAQDSIMAALVFHLLPERRPMSHSNRAKPRKATADVLLTLDVERFSIDVFSLEDNEWKTLACGIKHDRIYYYATAVAENQLLLVGRQANDEGMLNIVKSFNILSLTWTTLPAMNMHRDQLGAAVLGGLLYAAGGYDESRISSKIVERFNPAVRQWSYVAEMLTERYSFGVAVLHNKLYAIGGYSKSNNLKTVECYDPCTDTWSFCAPMSTPRFSMGVGVLNECIYVLGGYVGEGNCSDFVERYDPKTDKWCMVAPMSVPKSHVGVAALSGRLFAIGGWNHHEWLDLVEAYDPVLNEWRKMPSISGPGPRSCFVVKKSSLPPRKRVKMIVEICLVKERY